MTSFPARLRAAPIVPVLTVADPERAGPLARALVAGGVRFLEVTLRTPAALEALAAIKRAAPGAVVGAGTVLTPADLDAALRAGADFVVTPGLTARLRDALRAARVDAMVGAATASEVMTRLDDGFEVIKFFPAEPLGGVAALKALAAPLPQARFCPTGGVIPATLGGYLAQACVCAVGGGWIAPAQDVEAGAFAAIEARARAAADIALSLPPAA